MKKYVQSYEKAKTNMAFEKMDPYYDLEMAQNNKPKGADSKVRPYSARH